MGKHTLDEDDVFWDNLEDVLFIAVKKDKTVNIKTSIMDMDELRSVLTTAYMMAMFQHMKSSSEGLDNLQ